MSQTAYELLLDELEAFLRPITDAADDEAARRDLFDALEKEVPESAALTQQLVTVRDVLETLTSAADDPPETLAEFAEVLVAVDSLMGAVQAIESAVEGVDVEGLAGALLEHLAVRYLQAEHPILAYVATLLRVLEFDPSAEGPGAGYRTGASLYSAGAAGNDLRLDRIPVLLEDPAKLKDLYLPGALTTQEDVQRLQSLVFPWLAALLGSLGFRPQYGLPVNTASADFGPDAVKDKLGDGYRSLVQDEDYVLSTQPLAVFKEFEGTTVGGAFMLGVSDQGELGLVVVPLGEVSVSHTSEEWSVELAVTTTADAFVIGADGIAYTPAAGSTPVERIAGSASVEKIADPDTDAAFLVGPEGGTRLEIGTFGLDADAEVTEDAVDADLLVRAGSSAFVLSAGEGDGFLQTVLPDELRADFDLGIGWATSRGVYLEGSGGLEATFPIHRSIGGVVSIDNVNLSIRPDSTTGSVPVVVTTTAGVSLGPVQAVVEEIGLVAELTFPEGADGNLGPIDVDLGFKPPTGAALSVDASAVVGGGYLYFDHEQQRYAGALTLKIGTLTLNAIGLLTTRLPDGSDGFSLLVIIAGEFPPVQLGFGFTLNAVGGLLGVNRGARVEPLRASVRDNSIRSVLFPQDPIRNAPTLISDLRRFFPPTRAQHVFGPMAELGWGTPTIVRAQLGLLLELPSPVRLLILGRIQAVLPDDEVALLLLQMNALGVINFDEGTASVDASLYDSRVVAYTLTGDMAMRANWGDDPDFGLAVGGFHPKFDPPPAFPALRRVAVALAAGDNPRLRMEGYFALTSNTVQVGAAVDAYAAAAGFSVTGHLGFDALFQFDPFKFLIDFAARVSVRGHGLSLGLGLEGSLEGPSPWHLRGKAYIDLFLFEATVRVNATIGDAADSPGIPPAQVYREFRAALRQPGNWSAQIPAVGDSLVTLRQIEPGETELLAHPLGQLTVVQRVVPMDVAIERFGNAEPADYATFRIAAVGVDDHPDDALEGSTLEAEFAPAQYFDLTDSQKLSRPSFEQFPAGWRVVNEGVGYGGRPDDDADPLGDEAASQTLEYESVYVDEETGEDQPFFALTAIATADALTEASAVAQSPARTTGTAKFAPDGGPRIGVDDTRYTVATADTIEPVDDAEVPVEGTTYAQAEQAREAYAAENPETPVQVVTLHEVDRSGGGP